jgi:hypothetical protein
VSHLALAFGSIGMLYAIRRALDYDLRNTPTGGLQDAASMLWCTNMAAWRLAALGVS